jgi:HK97 family phage prohead protease
MPNLLDLEVDGLQVRAAAATDFSVEDGVIKGRAVPYGVTVTLIPGLQERFEMGAFARQTKDPSRVKIMFGHGEVIGHATELEERQDGLWMEGRILRHDDVPEGRKALALLEAKVVDEMSVGFQQVRNGTEITETRNGTLVTHRRASLREISIVPFGAYSRGARVMSVRAEVDEKAWRSEWLAKIDALGK